METATEIGELLMPATVTVELFGIPRERAGTARITLTAETLGEVFQQLGQQFPAFATSCLKNNELTTGYLANINGQTFTRETNIPCTDGDVILILSADAGG